MDDTIEFRELVVGLENLEPGADGGREGSVEAWVSLIEALLAQAQRKSLMTGDTLRNLNVVPHITPQLRLKPGYMARAEGATQSGGDTLWSSSHFHRHFKMLADFRTNRSSTLRIEAFLFRLGSMVDGPDKQMIFNPGHPIPSTVVDSLTSITFSGIIGYTVIIANQATAQHFLDHPPSLSLENIGLTVPSAFFVAEAKLESVSLMDHIPQAIGELYACLKSLKKKFLRGALTSGSDWIFLIIELNPNGDGATYQHSPQLGQQEIGEMWPDLVAGILHYWAEHGFTGMQSDNNDWFEVDLPTQTST